MSIGIVGLGYVGLPLAMEFAEAGIDVIGIDVDPSKVAQLRRGHSHIEDVADSRLQAALGRCSFSTRYVDLHDAEAVLICVPTPLTANREPELGPLLSASRALGGVIRGQGLVCLFLAIFYAAGLWFTGLRYGVVIGLLTGLFSFVPYIGMAVGLCVGLVVATFQFQDWYMVAVVAAAARS